MNGIQNVIKIFAICLAVFLIVNIVGWMVFGISMFIQFLDITDEGIITDSVNIESAESETFPHIFDEQYARNLTEIDIDVKTAEINIVTNSDDILSVEIKRGEQKVLKTNGTSDFYLVVSYNVTSEVLNEEVTHTGAGFTVVYGQDN